MGGKKGRRLTSLTVEACPSFVASTFAHAQYAVTLLCPVLAVTHLGAVVSEESRRAGWRK